MSIRVIKPGPLSSLQDLGRAGFQRFGVIVCGAMDEWSHRVANLLVGNLADEATLEITLMGPSLAFEETALVAILGADLSPRIGDTPVPMGRPVLVRAGSQLDFGRRAFGCRAYLAVHGGFAVAPVMGSRSTYLRAGFGGFEGRALRKGDALPVGVGDPRGVFPSLARGLDAGAGALATLPEGALGAIAHPATEPRALRAIAGQQWDAFTDEAQSRFLGAAFEVNANSDRMGYRLEGPALALRAPLEMISEGVAFGTVQVPPDGNPIVLMADRQTAGGYPKIAAVASVDLPLIAQAVPRESVRFERVSLEDAQRLLVEREHEIDRIRRSVDTLRGAL
jgi:antagonist of KipI